MSVIERMGIMWEVGVVGGGCIMIIDFGVWHLAGDDVVVWIAGILVSVDENWVGGGKRGYL